MGSQLKVRLVFGGPNRVFAFSRGLSLQMNCLSKQFGGRGKAGSILAEELLCVFNEADENDDGGACEADEEHDLEDFHGE